MGETLSTCDVQISIENLSVNIFAICFQYGFTPLEIASQEGHLSVVELLVSVGAQVNCQDNVSYNYLQLPLRSFLNSK